MAANERTVETTSGRELYVRYLLLLGKAIPTTLKVVITNIEAKENKSLAVILEEKKDVFRHLYLALLQEHEANTHIDSWDISVLCDAISVLLGSQDLDYIQCIRDQRQGIEEYSKSASLGYKIFKEKKDSLLTAIHELIDDRELEGKYKCERLIHSYESIPINVSKGLIEKMRQAKNVNEQIEMVIHVVDSPAEDNGSKNGKEDNSERKEQDLKIDEELHVVEDNLKEDMEITLVCSVNKDAQNPKWFHKGKVIVPGCRLLAVSNGQEHKLIIMRARLEDDGEYTVVFEKVTSRTVIVVKANCDLRLKLQLTETDYRNWVRGVLGLKCLKLGLERISDNAVQKHHEEILKCLPGGKQCSLCNEGNLRPFHDKRECYRKQNKHKCLCSKSKEHTRVCPTARYCSDFYDSIVRDHRYEDPLLRNTNIGSWSSDPWSVATCYINIPGYNGKTSSHEVDCTGLLCLFINNKTYLQKVNIGVFDMARTIRNEILHNANNELSETQLAEYLNQIQEVLEEVKKDPNAMDQQLEAYIKELNELKEHQIEIKFVEELQEFKDHAMAEDAEVVDKAQKQKDEELEKLKEKLKQGDEEVELIARLRSARKQEKKMSLVKGIKTRLGSWVGFDLLLELRIHIRGPQRESPLEALQCVYNYMSAEVKHHKKQMGSSYKQAEHGSSETAIAIHRLLHYIRGSKDTEVQEVIKSEVDSKACLKIRCSSSKTLEKFLVVLHGARFQELIAELRRSLTVEKEEKLTYDVEANCSSTSMNAIRKKLYERGILKGIAYYFPCEKHDGTQNAWYCSDHDAFCCTGCMKNYHSSCAGLRSFVSNTNQEAKEKRISIKRKKREYSVPHHDQERHNTRIYCLCVLPSGELLICDYYNARLKKLDTSYKLVRRHHLKAKPKSMCYIDNNRAAVALEDTSIEIMNVEGDINPEQTVRLDYIADSLACHGDILFTCDGEIVRTLKTDGSQERVLYKGNICHNIAVSDYGNILYIACADGLIVIDNEGNLLSSLKTEELRSPYDLCCVGDGSVLVYDDSIRSIVQVDSTGKQMLGTVITEQSQSLENISFCYDRQRSSLVLVDIDSDYISVFELEYIEHPENEA